MFKIKRKNEKQTTEKEKDLMIAQLKERLAGANMAITNIHSKYDKLLSQQTGLINDNSNMAGFIEQCRKQFLGKETYFYVYENELFTVVGTTLVRKEGMPDRLEVQLVKV